MSLHSANPVFDDADLILGFRSYLEICREDYGAVLEVLRNVSPQPAKNEYCTVPVNKPRGVPILRPVPTENVGTPH
jgi:hypothetical protein